MIKMVKISNYKITEVCLEEIKWKEKLKLLDQL